MHNNRLQKILVANRGEIASRIIRAVHKSGLKAVAVYSPSDRGMPYVQLADEAWPLHGKTLADTYLDQQKIIDIALSASASAIHPGYGFLSENAAFAALCRKNDITFIGPSPEVIDLMGHKSNARSTAKKLGVPVIEGTTGSMDKIMKQSETLEYPVLIKPAAGGGGKGMHIVRRQEELKEAMDDAAREAKNYFGSAALYVERYIERARHIEVQVLADNHGNAVHLYERECTLQRRYQKIIEEAPSPSLSEETRAQITHSALELTRGIGYTNAGTIEFLVDDQERFYFIEMNTRIQVEHPVTEMITGLDLVREQISIASGNHLSISQQDIQISGHAIEARLYAEDPNNEFLPSTGTIHQLNTELVKVRTDDGYRAGNSISPFYDPMISKVISHGSDRKEATRQLMSALQHYHVSGITTNREFLVYLIHSQDFRENIIYTRYIDDHLTDILLQLEKEKETVGRESMLAIFTAVAVNHQYPENRKNVWEEIGHWRQLPAIGLQYNGSSFRIPYRTLIPGRSLEVMVNEKPVYTEILEASGNCYKILTGDRQFRCWTDVDGPDLMLDVEQFYFRARRTDIPDDKHNGTANGGLDEETNEITAPLNGKIVKINVRENDTVKGGDTLLVIESMKMENRINAPRDAEIEQVSVRVGDLVELNKLLVILK